MRPLDPPEEILGMAGTGEVKIKTTEPMQVAYLVHRGPYSEIGESLTELMLWISQNGYELMGPAITIYHTDPVIAKSEEDYITEIQFPVNLK